MFTGLIQGIGQLKSLTENKFSINLTSSEQKDFIMLDLAIGDSVAVDGVCLTVEKILNDGFIATASGETLNRTTLGKKKDSNDYVNLETSLRAGGKIGGHFVTGHVDGIGYLVESFGDRQAWQLTFSYPSNLQSQWVEYIAPYIISKGSITVNGISLTVADCDYVGNWFKVVVIPVTYYDTNLTFLKKGDLVNIESDILGKYIRKLVNFPYQNNLPPDNISVDFLTENGYL